ncbi:MAG: hypothetical protein FWG94_03685 [Oscillospiraceae bacterium]|nr:hypothetical protein [Oscillospiraceae bacterium]
MGYILGIDQGFSKTHVLIGDADGKIIGFGKSNGAIHSDTGLRSAVDAVRQAAESAMRQGNLKMDQIDVVVAGMTGIDWPDEPGIMKEALHRLFNTENIIVVNDCIIALRAEINSGQGAILCAGSGLNCAVKKDGNLELVYGFYIDDTYQGGSSLGKQVVKAVVDAQIGLAPQTMLTGMLLEYFMVPDVDALLRRQVTRGISSKEYLSLPILLEQAAMKNDAVALDIWADYGTGIAQYVVAGLKQLGILEQPIQVVLSGSIFKCKVPSLREGVSLGIHRRAVNAVIIDAVYEPVVGAYLMGLDTVWNEIPAHVMQTVTSNADFFVREK